MGRDRIENLFGGYIAMVVADPDWLETTSARCTTYVNRRTGDMVELKPPRCDVENNIIITRGRAT